ncbi:MAG: hypothetical protein NW208_08855 [Bryobacter sp.]|nr:hypothetical protein [Bryobacter sp.]
MPALHSFFSLLSLFSVMLAATPLSAAEKLKPVDFCQLTQHPDQWDGKLIRINAQVNSGQEMLVLEDTSCEQPTSIWLTFGGRREAPVAYCCGAIAGAKRKSTLTINGFRIPLHEDSSFRDFHRRLESGPGSFTAQLEGRFFAKTQEGGFGHFGMFHLFVVIRVL